MRITFDKKEHCYAVNGDIASISVTELLAKHGLAPKYDNISDSVLARAKARGNKVHKDCENIVNNKEYVPETYEGERFLEWVTEKAYGAVAEQMIAYDYKGMVIAGTADLLLFLKDGKAAIADHKTTAILNKEYVSWQVSLLDYFFRKLGSEKLNGKSIPWKGAQKFICLHYTPDGAMAEVELEKVPDENIEALLEAEYKGEKYQRPMLVIDSALIAKIEEAESFLVKIESEYKAAQERTKQYREQLLAAFEAQKIKSWESPDGKVKVTYVFPAEKMSLDSAKVKKEYPDVYTKCQKLTKQKGYVRVTVREDEEC